MVTRRLRPIVSLIALAMGALMTDPYIASAQPEAKAPTLEVPFQIESMEIHRFDPPIRIGSGERSLTYGEALVFTLVVTVEDYDGLPPSVEPFLYVGDVELRTFRILRDEEGRTLRVVFHARDWDRLENGSPMVLTADHVAGPKAFERLLRIERFEAEAVVDKRN